MQDPAQPANPMDDLFVAAEEAEAQRGQLIEAIYRIALDPQSYDAFMHRWDAYITQRLLAREAPGGSEDAEPPVPGLESHFQIADRLLEQTMPPPNPPGVDAALAVRTAPRFLIDRTGRVVWHNAVAARLFDLDRVRALDDLGMDAPARATLQRMVDDPDTARPAVIGLHSAGNGDVVHCRVQPIRNDGADPVILVAPVTTAWPAAMAVLLREDFGLTPSEIEVCEAVADGRSAAQIALARGAALGTVRTQIKKVMAKTGTGSGPELVRLLHVLMRLAEDQRGMPTVPGTSGGQGRPIMLARGAMPVDVHGPQTGDAVIFLHGMLDGTGITARCGELLDWLRLRMICPIRPFFGPAAGDPGPAATAPRRFADDIQTLIRTMRLNRVVVMGHMAGAVYAHAAAAAAPAGQVAGIVNVAGGVPILGPGQFAAMTPRQRLVAYTARYSPRVLPFVLRAGIRQMRTGGERKFLMSLYETSPMDLPIATDPDIERILLDGFRFSVAQGHQAFEVDSRQVVNDWSAIADSHDLPVRLIHGVQDPVVAIASVRAFAALRPGRVTLDEVPEAGQLIFYQDPGRVLSAARALLDGQS
jgi:pimeloyl-ACP methyl ester carboxylesterase/DNA-binding CsgD family transcriptional regulator